MKILKCEHCGNIINMIEDKKVPPFCCGTKMTVLTGLEQDGATEKHVPVVKEENDKLIIEVGSVMHPVTEEHYISFIAIERENGVEIIDVKEKQPKIEVCNLDYKEVYAYCNLHGLWKVSK